MTAAEFARQVASVNRLEMHLRAAAIIAEELAPFDLEPVVVGGTAVEFYTRGAYLTADVNIVVADFQQVRRVLTNLSFDLVGAASFVHPDLDLVVDLPREPLEGDPGRLQGVTVDGRTVFVIGLEVIIADRLRAAAHWHDLASEEWAGQLMAAWGHEVDWTYLAALPDSRDPDYAAAGRSAKALAARVVAGASPPPSHDDP